MALSRAGAAGARGPARPRHVASPARGPGPRPRPGADLGPGASVGGAARPVLPGYARARGCGGPGAATDAAQRPARLDLFLVLGAKRVRPCVGGWDDDG